MPARQRHVETDHPAPVPQPFADAVAGLPHVMVGTDHRIDDAAALELAFQQLLQQPLQIQA